jgi:hypothetical protein
MKTIPVKFSGINAWTVGLTGYHVEKEDVFPSFINYFNFNLNEVTTISTINQWTKLNATTTKGFHRNGLTHTNNRVTYNPPISYGKTIFKLEGIITAFCGNTTELHFAFFKNEQLIPCSEQSMVTTAKGIHYYVSAIPIQCLVELDTNDYVEVWTKNATSTDDITLVNLNVIITEM